MSLNYPKDLNSSCLGEVLGSGFCELSTVFVRSPLSSYSPTITTTDALSVGDVIFEIVVSQNEVWPRSQWFPLNFCEL